MNFVLDVIRKGSHFIPMITFFYIAINHNNSLAFVLFAISFINLAYYLAITDHFKRVIYEKKVKTLDKTAGIMFRSNGVVIYCIIIFILQISSIIIILNYLVDINSQILLLVNIAAFIYQIVFSLFNKDIIIKQSKSIGFWKNRKK